MTKSIDFYFDFISPYAYIAYKNIIKINNIQFNFKPILLGGLHNLVEITAPALNKFKLKNMKNDCELISKKIISILFGILNFLLIHYIL